MRPWMREMGREEEWAHCRVLILNTHKVKQEHSRRTLVKEDIL